MGRNDSAYIALESINGTLRTKKCLQSLLGLASGFCFMNCGLQLEIGLVVGTTLAMGQTSMEIDTAVWVALIGGGAGLLSAFMVGLVRLRADRRHVAARDFSDALADALEWIEFIYIIHRRSEGPQVRDEIRGQMNNLQKRLLHHKSWLRIESPAVHGAYSKLLDKIKSESLKPIQDGWNKQPVTSDPEMNLGSSIVAPQCDLEVNTYVDEVDSHLKGYVIKFWK